MHLCTKKKINKIIKIITYGLMEVVTPLKEASR